ncbi:hypothetical protein SLS58_008700 [Diplodia intermedia]|uniref:ASST-domain-containing protein n=1 Tax=Diplodia intermedia TaxID=856260 RepID=A0ABR3TGP9_9PEZI
MRRAKRASREAPARRTRKTEDGQCWRQEEVTFRITYQRKCAANEQQPPPKQNLIWSGAAALGGISAHGPHVCSYHGADHLCVFQGASHVGFARGVGLILDAAYQIVKVVQAGGSTAGAGDMHEFRLVDGGRGALVSVYQVAPYDLSPFGMADGVGWIVEGAFQEVRVDDGEVLFEWRSLDHRQTGPRHGRVLPGATPVGGTGRLPAAPWDYFHINSVDKNADGDYLVSARHTSTIYKISAARGGAVEWRLCGQDDGEVEEGDVVYQKLDGLNFSSQHDARWLHHNATHSTLSFFDNAFDDYTATATHSRGLVVLLDHAARTASLLAEYTAPEARPNGNATDAVLSGSQGNLQLLPGTGNAFVGWGIWPFFSEHAAGTGAPLLWGEVAHNGSRVMDYRARKFNWTATPHDCPTLFAYSLDGAESGTAMYVSWNGATVVDTWNFYTADAADGPWRWAGWANWTGFETRWRWANYSRWSFAEAIGADGGMIRRSAVVGTFVPSERLREAAACDGWGCKAMPAAAAVDGDGEMVVEPEKIVPEDVDWDGVGYRVGFEGVEHYPPQPPRRLLSLAWQVGPQIGLGAAVFLFVVLMWASRKMGGGHAKGKYQRVGGKDGDCEEGGAEAKDEVCDCEECCGEVVDENGVEESGGEPEEGDGEENSEKRKVESV